MLIEYLKKKKQSLVFIWSNTLRGVRFEIVFQVRFHFMMSKHTVWQDVAIQNEFLWICRKKKKPYVFNQHYRLILEREKSIRKLMMTNQKRNDAKTKIIFLIWDWIFGERALSASAAAGDSKLNGDSNKNDICSLNGFPISIKAIRITEWISKVTTLWWVRVVLFFFFSFFSLYKLRHLLKVTQK